MNFSSAGVKSKPNLSSSMDSESHGFQNANSLLKPETHSTSRNSKPQLRANFDDFDLNEDELAEIESVYMKMKPGTHKSK